VFITNVKDNARSGDLLAGVVVRPRHGRGPFGARRETHISRQAVDIELQPALRLNPVTRPRHQLAFLDGSGTPKSAQVLSSHIHDRFVISVWEQQIKILPCDAPLKMSAADGVAVARPDRSEGPNVTRMYGPAVRCKRFLSIWQSRSCINVSGL
jgi:hypothetical protein